MNAPSTTDTIQRQAPAALWRVAGAFMHILHALFGAPADVAARHTLRFEAHKLMASWLRAGEAMMRRLLLIEAAAYAKPNTRPLLREPRKRTRKLMHFTAEAPEKWRVSFRCFISTKTTRALSPSKGGATHTALRQAQGSQREDRWCSENWKPVRFRSAWPIAERYEALLRVFKSPLACARRLAHRLFATPHRLRDVLRAPPEAAHRVDRFAELTAAAETKAAMFNSS